MRVKIRGQASLTWRSQFNAIRGSPLGSLSGAAAQVVSRQVAVRLTDYPAEAVAS